MTTTGIFSEVCSCKSSGSKIPMHSFIVSALAISCGRKYFPLSNSSPTSLIAGSSCPCKSSCGELPASSAFFVKSSAILRFPLAPPLAPALPPAAVVFLHPLLSAGPRRLGLPYFPAGLPSQCCLQMPAGFAEAALPFGIRLFPTFLCLTGKFDITDITVFFI